jgi:predicted nucleic acid-binding protein
LDGAVIAAAERLGATTLYTEDLNHRQHCGSVQAINPFLQESTDSVHEGSDSRYG